MLQYYYKQKSNFVLQYFLIIRSVTYANSNTFSIIDFSQWILQ